jgi:ribosomal protein L2
MSVQRLASAAASCSSSSAASLRGVRALSSVAQVPNYDVSPPTLPPFMRRSRLSPAAVALATHGGEPTRRERRTAQKAQRKAEVKRKAESSIFAKAGVAAQKYAPYVRRDRQFKTFKPITRSLRWTRYVLTPHLHRGKPERALTIAKRGTGGRNSTGRVTVRGRGGGHRRRLRLIDFYRRESGEQEVLRIEYDPGRSAHIALIQHKVSGLKSYILAPEGLRAGDTVESYRSGENTPAGDGEASSLDIGIFRTRAIRPGNVLPLSLIPIGTKIHAATLVPNGPAKLIRSAGAEGQLIAFVKRAKAALPGSVGFIEPSESDEELSELDVSSGAVVPTHAQVKLTSGEVRLLPMSCAAAIGRVSNIDHEHVRLGKAGRARWLGIKPKVRGVAMK